MDRHQPEALTRATHKSTATTGELWQDWGSTAPHVREIESHVRKSYPLSAPNRRPALTWAGGRTLPAFRPSLTREEVSPTHVKKSHPHTHTLSAPSHRRPIWSQKADGSHPPGGRPPPMNPMNPSGGSPFLCESYGSLWWQALLRLL